MQSKELKKSLRECPFCGGEVKIIAEQIDARTISYELICKNLDCGSVTYFDYCDKEEAIAQWNTRKPMERIDEQLMEQILLQEGKCLWGNSFLDGLRKALDIVRKGGVDNG